MTNARKRKPLSAPPKADDLEKRKDRVCKLAVKWAREAVQREVLSARSHDLLVAVLRMVNVQGGDQHV